MSLAKPTLDAVRVGVSGQVRLDIAADTENSVIVYYQADQLDAGGSWASIAYDSTGSKLVTGLTDGQWYTFYAVMTDGTETSPPSDSVKVRPMNVAPYYSIELARESLEEYVEGRTTAYRLKVQAVDPVNMPTEVFLYRRELFSALTTDIRDVFLAVCKPGDLEQFPAGAPLDGQEPPFFRLSYVDLVDPHIDLMEELWDAIQNDVVELVSALEANRFLARSGRVQVYAGTATTGDDSSSSDSSSSSSA